MYLGTLTSYLTCTVLPVQLLVNCFRYPSLGLSPWFCDRYLGNSLLACLPPPPISHGNLLAHYFVCNTDSATLTYIFVIIDYEVAVAPISIEEFSCHGQHFEHPWLSIHMTVGLDPPASEAGDTQKEVLRTILRYLPTYPLIHLMYPREQANSPNTTRCYGIRRGGS